MWCCNCTVEAEEVTDFFFFFFFLQSSLCWVLDCSYLSNMECCSRYNFPLPGFKAKFLGHLWDYFNSLSFDALFCMNTVQLKTFNNTEGCKKTKNVLISFSYIFLKVFFFFLIILWLIVLFWEMPLWFTLLYMFFFPGLPY